MIRNTVDEADIDLRALGRGMYEVVCFLVQRPFNVVNNAFGVQLILRVAEKVLDDG